VSVYRGTGENEQVPKGQRLVMFKISVEASDGRTLEQVFRFEKPFNVLILLDLALSSIVQWLGSLSRTPLCGRGL
jgi:hypothetical protein